VGGLGVESGVVLGEEDLVEFTSPLTRVSGFDPGEGLGGVAVSKPGREHVFDYTLPRRRATNQDQGGFALSTRGNITPDQAAETCSQDGVGSR
jgi:hypothetical protein